MTELLEQIAQVIQEHSYAVEEGRYGMPRDWADRILALVRPVEGIVLSRDAAGAAAAAIRIALRQEHEGWTDERRETARGLASRLEGRA